MAAGIPGRVGVITQQRFQLNLQAGLLLRFPHRRVLQGLTHVHETAGDGPAVGRVLAFDEHDGPVAPQLEPAQRQAVALAYLRDQSHSEIAEALTVPLGTIKSWIRRGLAKLKTCLGGE